MILRNENVYCGDCGAMWDGIMNKDGEKSNQMFIPITLAWFGLVVKGHSSQHMGDSSHLTTSLMFCEEGTGQDVSHQHWG